MIERKRKELILQFLSLTLRGQTLANIIEIFQNAYHVDQYVLTVCLQKARRGRESSPLFLLIRYNTQPPWIIASIIQTNGNHHHFFIRIPILGHALVHSVDKINALVLTVELVWLLFLNMFFFFNFVPTPNKSLRFTRFRRSYENCTAVVLTNHCQNYTTFLINVRCSKWPRFFFCSYLSPMIVHLRNPFLLSTFVARMLLTQGG